MCKCKIYLSKELETALAKTKERHPHICFDPFGIRRFVGNIDMLKKEMSFVEALRAALNMCGIGDKDTRRAYASLAGTYFGKHGGHQTAKTKKLGKARAYKQEQRARRQRTLVNKVGQYEFDI